MEFHLPYLKMLKDMGWETAVAARNDYDDPKDCVIPYCDQYYNVPFERNPFHPGNLKAYRMLKKIFRQGKYDIIHCHTPVGAMLTRMAAGEARKKGCKVFYTVHGFHFYKGAPWINWLLYYPAEKILARKTDVLITINQEDYARAQTFPAKQVTYTPGIGIDTGRFRKKETDGTADRKVRDEFQIPEDGLILLSVGEVNKNKNHRMVIELLPKLENVWYILCGRGPLIETYEKTAETLGVKNRLIMTGYRTDIAEFYQAADIFVFPSFREGMPVSVMEAMAAGLPVVCTNIRGNRDLIKDHQGGFLFGVTHPEELLAALQKLMADEELRKAFGTYNTTTLDEYEASHVVNKVQEMYLAIAQMEK